MQKSIFRKKNSKKFVYYNEELETNSKFQAQLSQKLQRFRTCRKNKKCFIFHDLSEYIIFSYGCKLLNWSFKSTKFSYPYIVTKPIFIFNISTLKHKWPHICVQIMFGYMTSGIRLSVCVFSFITGLKKKNFSSGIFLNLVKLSPRFK